MNQKQFASTRLRPRAAVLPLAAAATILLAGVPLQAAAAPAPLRICAIDDRSGGSADTGLQSHDGILLAVEEINAAGGVGGRKIELKAYDSKLDAQQAASFATRCTEDDKALAIVGGNPTAPAAAIISVATENAIPFLSLGASADNLTDPPRPYHFRLGPANRQDAGAVAEMLERQGFKRVAIVGCSVPFGIDSMRALSDLLDKKKIAIVAKQTYDVSAADLSPQLSNVRNAKPDVVVVFPYPADGARVMRTARQIDLRVPFVVPRVSVLETFRKLSGEAGDGVLIPTPVDISRTDVQQFFATLQKRYGPHQPTMYPPIGYDSIKIVAQVAAQPSVLKALDAGKLAEARKAFQDEMERIGQFKGLMGQQGATYRFGPKDHHGPPDEKWFVWTSLAGKGTQMVPPDFSKVKPK